jgi:GMP synthase-like glutamine amidotransferase
VPNHAAPSCLIVQHLEPEAPYAIGDALTDAGVVTDVRRVYEGEPLPSDLADFTGLVIMGGPMSALSDDGFPSRRAEIALLDDALSRGLPTLGVCLGAQLLALAAGGVVHAGPTGPEIGWGPVSLTDQADEDPLLAGLPPTLTVLHWHGDTFELPPGAIHLAASARYRNQAFGIAARAWGFQFHLEVDHRAVAAFVGAFGADATAAGTTPESIEADSAEVLEVLTPGRTEVLSRFAGLVATHDHDRLADRSTAVLPPR